ncbi:hypothetical protein P7K49_002518 [Saguinus oedipus]|uniref:Uncharacterized protein n=1 Tax=Saguinus oedipus TaxID=9490 RepID=A0ABQ9WLI3_SAGOE|nr:hypothetical protein P7K49_002518 [Saguinus oedipus]
MLRVTSPHQGEVSEVRWASKTPFGRSGEGTLICATDRARSLRVDIGREESTGLDNSDLEQAIRELQTAKALEMCIGLCHSALEEGRCFFAHTDGLFRTPPGYGCAADRAEEQRRYQDGLPYIDDSPSSLPHLSSKGRDRRDALVLGLLESTKVVSPHGACVAGGPDSLPDVLSREIGGCFEGGGGQHMEGKAGRGLEAENVSTRGLLHETIKTCMVAPAMLLSWVVSGLGSLCFMKFSCSLLPKHVLRMAPSMCPEPFL